MRSIRRTDDDDGYFVIADALAGKSPNDIITGQEKQGQHDLVNSDVLPTEISFDRDGNRRKALEDAGVVFGEVVPDDPLFQYVQLPPGWKKVATDHDMWSMVCDENGRERIAVFYKAAFYDRKAHISPVCRFFYGTDYDAPYYTYYNMPLCGMVVERHTDGKERKIWRSEPGDHEITRYAGKLWLEKYFPDYENVNAYWDVPEQKFTGYTI